MKWLIIVLLLMLLSLRVEAQGIDAALETAQMLLREANGRVIQLSAQSDLQAKRIKTLEDELAKLKAPLEPKKDQ